MTLASELPAIIVGGGIGGLTTAYRLAERGRPFLLLEASGRLGGNIQTERVGEFVYDCGPDSFLRTKPEGKALCEELGLGDELISPRSEGAKVFVARDGVLHPMPAGLALGFPTRLGALLSTQLLSGEGKLRAMLEPFVPPRGKWQHDEESIAAFVRRRVGTEMGDRVVAPLLGGVFAGDAEKLSMQSAFPQLVAVEQKAGSLFAGMTGSKSLWSTLTRPKANPPNPFLSLRGGLQTLTDALAARLPAESIRLNTAVADVARGEPTGVRVRAADGRIFDGSHVVLAGAPWAAAPIVDGLDAKLSKELGDVVGRPTATVFFGLDETAMERPLDGSGFIVPPGEGEILASTWVSSKWQGRAPKGAGLVRAFLGGARGFVIEGKSDDELASIAHRELTRLMGDLGPMRFSRVHRYPRGTPQPEMGHGARLERIRERLAVHPWLSLVGPGYGGVGIPDCVRMATDAVARLAGEAAAVG